jgi:hypothetical protein
MKPIKIMIVILLLSNLLNAQQIIWTNKTSNYNLPSGIEIYEGSRQSPLLKIYYVDADLNNPDLCIRPYISSTNYSVDNFNDIVGAYASVNGGFFGGNVSYSTVVYPSEVKAANVSSVSRNSKTYPVIRSMFSMKTDRTFSVDWIYHFGNTIEDIYKFSSPLPYTNNDLNPQPVPLKSNGEKLNNLLSGIGGAPVLIKDGKINISYNEEIMWGSGVGYDNRDPRTAVGYKSNKHVIMLVADGRGSTSEGVSLIELAQIMNDIGCYEAINLDGGGSTQLAIGKSYVNSPAGIRPVPTILSVVHSDSVKSISKPLFEKIIDTEDNSVVKVGSWFESANAGYYGTSKSLLLTRGNGANFIKYSLNLPADNKYEIYAWWVSASNRCTDTPYIVHHKEKSDTVRVDQTKNGSSWQKLGSFTFTADSNAYVIISDAATSGTYVTADAIKIISYQNVTDVNYKENKLPTGFYLSQNYPNPFNPVTTISYGLPLEGPVELKVFDVLGREVKELVNQFQLSGYYQVILNGIDLSSGVYFYRLKGAGFQEARKLMLLK